MISNISVGRGGAMPRSGGVSNGMLPPGPVYGGAMPMQPDYTMGPVYQQGGQFGTYTPQQGPQIGLIGSEQAVNQGLGMAMGALDAGLGRGGPSIGANYDHINQNRDMALGQMNQGIGALNPVVRQGQQAADVQAALSGAMGAQAQAQAFADFQASPGQSWLQEQGERAILRNQAAIGGMGGGNVMKELTRFGQGVANQDFQNYYNRLGGLADRGVQGLGMQTQLRGQGMGAATSAGQQGAGVQGSAIGANAGVQAAGINAQSALAQAAASHAMQAGMLNAAGRTGASSALADLYNGQGAGMADIYGNGMLNMGNVLAGGGDQQSLAYQNLGNQLSNLGMQGASIVGGQPAIPGVQNNTGILQRHMDIRHTAHSGTNQAAQAFNNGMQGAGSLMTMMSDARLKASPKKVGVFKGHNVYRWTWAKAADHLPVGPAIGVMAHEVARTNPEAVSVHESGYLMVNYGAL